MTAYYGVNNTLNVQDVPSQKIPPGDFAGKLRVARDSFTVGASGTLTTADTIELMKIPKGARVIDVIAYADEMGGAGAFDIGDGSDADRFIDGLDAGSAAAIKRMSQASPGAGVLAGSLFDELSAEITVTVTPVTNPTTPASKKIEVVVLYVDA